MAKPAAVVVGTNFGRRVHVPALRAAGYEVVGLVGRVLDKTAHIAEKLGVPGAYATLQDALATKPHVVTVSTSPDTHAGFVREAIEGGAHVLCEKPFALTVDEAVELTALARAKGKVGLLGHEFRYVESTALFGRLLDQEAVGPARWATFVADSTLAEQVGGVFPNWWFDRSKGGGWFGASGSHAIDRIRDWYGEVEGVSAHLASLWDREPEAADDSFALMFRTSKGVQGIVQSTVGAFAQTYSLTKAQGPRGGMWIDDEYKQGIVEAIMGPVRLATLGSVRTVEVPEDLRLPRTPDLPQDAARSIDPFAQLFRDMTRLMEGGEIAQGRPRPATFEDGVANMRVMEAVRASAAQGGAWVAP